MPAKTPVPSSASSSPLIVPSGIKVPDVDMLRANPPDFNFFTATLEDTGGVLTTGQQSSDSMVLHAIGSSTVQDLQGDFMELSALQDMTKVGAGFAIMLNHEYRLPEDLAGHLIASPSIVVNGGIGDLHMDISIWSGNPRAVATYQAIHDHKTTLGISIGCMIDDAEWRGPNNEPLDQNAIDFWDVVEGRALLHITHVTTVEFSIVSIPANRRSWVQNAAQGLFQRSLAEGNIEQARLLAPIVRADDSSRYTKIVRGVGDPSLRRSLSQLPPRAGSSRDVLWSSSTKAFYLTSNTGQREIARDDLSQMLAKAASAVVVDTEPDLLLDDGSDDLEAKGATGKSSWPLADRSRSWDGGAAHKRLLEWAGGQDDLSTSKFRSVHFWSPEGEAAKNVSDYKLAFCDVVDGAVKAIPAALIACWGGHGVNAADIPDSDKAAIRKKLSAYAARMRSEFGDDDIMPPWDREDKATEPDKADSLAEMEETTSASAEEVTTAELPDSGVETRSEEPAAEAEAPAEADSIEQAPETDVEASADPQESILEGLEPDVLVSGTGGDILVKADGSHEAYTGSHSHGHPAFGSQGEDDTHSHEHSHDGDANHHHSHQDSAEPEQTDAAEPAEETPAPASEAHVTPADGTEDVQPMAASAVDVVTLAKEGALNLYNSIGASLGFAPVTLAGIPDRQKRDLVENDDEAQRVITIVSGLDCLTDELMDLLGVPDMDQDSEGAESASYAMEPEKIIQRAIAKALLLKDGREFSRSNLNTLQSIHDSLNDMTDGALCKAVQSDEEDSDNAGVSDGEDVLSQAAPGSGPAKSFQAQMLLSIEEMSTSLKALIQEQGIAMKHVAEFKTAQAAAESLQASVAEMEEKLAGQRSDMDSMEQRIERMSEVKLPRPTHMARSVRPTDPALARYEDFLPAGQPMATLAAPMAALTAAAGSASGVAAAQLDEATAAAEYSLALERTQLIRRDTDGLTCRFWPAGVGFLASGQSVRPPLTPEQRSEMAIQDWTAYESGGAALVPEPGF